MKGISFECSKTIILNEWNNFKEALTVESDEEWVTLKHIFYMGALTAASKMTDSSLEESLSILKELNDWSAAMHEQYQKP